MSAHLEKTIMFMIQTYLNSEIVTRNQVIEILEDIRDEMSQGNHI
jgi:hypothetical protein